MGRSRELAELGSAYDSGSSLGFRNRIINGDMRIDQRNAGASLALINTERFPVDRFSVRSDATGVSGTIQQSTLAPAGFSNSLLVSITTGGTIGSTDRGFMVQNIEGFNLADLGFGTASASNITLSFWVRSSLTGTFSGALQNAAQTRAYVYTFSISAANTWEYKTISIPGETSGAWVTNNGNGMRVFFDIGNGSALRTSSTGSWQTSDLRGATGSVSLAANSGATFYITGVQLEAGSVATPFERRDYGRELMMCQRYYQKVIAETAYGCFCIVRGFGDSQANGVMPLSVQMRAAPTAAQFSGASGFQIEAGATLNVNNITSFAIDAGQTTPVALGIAANKTSSFTVNQFYQLMAAANPSAFIAASAEL